MRVRRARLVRSLRPTIWALAVASSLGAAPSFVQPAFAGPQAAAPASRPALKRGIAELAARQASFSAWAAGQPIAKAKVRSLAARDANIVMEATLPDNRLLIIRKPWRGAAQAHRVNLAIATLAAQLSEPNMVPLTARGIAQVELGRIAAGEEVTFMEHAGHGYVGADEAPHRLANVSERKRLVGALIDLMSEQLDRKLANLMVNEEGSARLIDPDATYGRGRGKNNPPKAYRSQFFPKGKLGYAGRYQKVADLPVDIQELVSAIADAPKSELMKIYGLEGPEVDVMVHQARQVRELGLDGAIEAFVKQFALKRDYGEKI